jgi:predicted NBD/HSP70 family sugar kinase
MNVLVVDVGGTHVKILATGQEERREFPSGPTLTAEQMVRGVKELAGDWKYDVVSIGYPGPVLHGRLPNRITSPRVGSGSTMVQHLGAPSRSSMMRPCKPWGATKAARCSSWAWGPVWVPP